MKLPLPVDWADTEIRVLHDPECWGNLGDVCSCDPQVVIEYSAIKR